MRFLQLTQHSQQRAISKTVAIRLRSLKVLVKANISNHKTKAKTSQIPSLWLTHQLWEVFKQIQKAHLTYYIQTMRY